MEQEVAASPPTFPPVPPPSPNDPKDVDEEFEGAPPTFPPIPAPIPGDKQELVEDENAAAPPTHAPVPAYDPNRSIDPRTLDEGETKVESKDQGGTGSATQPQPSGGGGSIGGTDSGGTQDPSSGGSNGDPIIMGLSGQVFKFDGRSGAWYSGISAPSFQYVSA